MVQPDRSKSPVSAHLNAGQIDLNLMNCERTTLGNGVEVYFYVNQATPIVRLDFLFSAGTAFQEKAFCAMTTAQLLTEGTKKHSALEIAEFVDFRGAYIEKSVDKESVNLCVFTLEKYVDDLIPLLSELCQEASFPEKEIHLLLGKKKQQYKIESQKTAFIAKNSFIEHVFDPAHPYARIGKKEDFDRLGREDLLRFHSEYYLDRPFQIIVSGAVKDKHLALLNQYFGRLPILMPSPYIQVKGMMTHPQKIYIDRKDAVQASVRIGKVCPSPKHEDFTKLSVLNTILGGYFGSRLMRNIREDKGYTYGIYSSLQIMKEISLFSIVADVKAEVDRLAIEEIYKEIQGLREVCVEEAELSLVKNYLTGVFIRNMDGVLELAERKIMLLQNQLEVDFYKQYLCTIQGITPAIIREMAQKYLDPDNFVEICVGNNARRESE